MFEECGRKALTDQKEKQMSDIRSKDMDQHNRVCAQIDLDAIAYNMEQMKDPNRKRGASDRCNQDGRIWAWRCSDCADV